MLQVFQRHVASFCSQYSSVFSNICCKSVYLDVAYVSHICCKCFIWILHMFYNGFKCFIVFLQVFQTHGLSVSSVFIRILQVLHLDVSKLDRVLHLPHHLLLARLGVFASSRWCQLRIRTRGACDVLGWWRSGRLEWRRRSCGVCDFETECRRERSDVRALALPIYISCA